MIADVVVIGAGPAGLAAAWAAAHAGADVLVLEREPSPGGILPQCVHDGFGIYLHGESLTGPEYAERWYERAVEAGARFAFATTVLSVERADEGFSVEAVGTEIGGRESIACAAVVAATGCRERVRGALGIPGTRPAGVMTAGEAQYLVNKRDLLPGKLVVVLGSGDIGLIMARRMTLEGAEVRLVLGAVGTGLLRNHIRCIEDMDVPFRCGWGVANIHGRGRLSAVTVAPLLDDGTFDMSRRERIACDLLLLACGLIPEREVLASFGGEEPDGLFVCGNAVRPHDLVDQVTQEGIRCGIEAAELAGCTGGAADDESRAFLEVRISEPKGRLSEIDPSVSEGAVTVTVCTACPTGCIVTVSDDGGVAGNGCSRGRDHALQEKEHPVRTFTGTVRVSGSAEPLLPVRTDRDVPREDLFRLAELTREIKAQAPVERGQVLVRDACGTGADLIACASRTAAAPVGA